MRDAQQSWMPGLGMQRSWMMAAIVGVLTTGCAVSQDTLSVAADPVPVAPPDFSLEVVLVLDAARDETLAHCIVLADGSLWADPWEERAGKWPSYRRTLSRRQVARLWAMAEAIESVDTRLPELPDAPTTTPDAARLVIDVTGDGRYRRYVLLPGENQDPVTAELLETLRRWSWLSELNAASPAPPLRYDLGPDPYARYRNP